MSSPYTITPHITLLQDSPQNIDYHIRSDDYFSFLATLMGFIEESFPNDERMEEYRKLARELRIDLRYIQANYKIIPRTLDDIQTVLPGGNLLKRPKR